MVKGINMIQGLKNKKQNYLIELRDEEKKSVPDSKRIAILQNRIIGLNKKLREVRK